MSEITRPIGPGCRQRAAARVRASHASRASRASLSTIICATLVGTLLAALPGAASAQPVQVASTILITATRSPMRVDDTLAEVSVVDRAAIDRAAGRTLAELLAQQPGVQFWADGGLGKRSSVSLRGLESRHTLLLIDGVRHGSATVGAPAWENLPLAMIERIEIVRGPLSGLYGSEAVGGVVQVFTRRPAAEGIVGGASAAAGSHRHAQLAAHLGGRSGAFDGAAGVQLTEERGFSATNEGVPFGQHDPDRDGFRQRAGHARLGWQLAEGWRLEAQALQSTGLTRIDDGPGADARAELRTGLAALRLAGRITAGWHSALRVARSTDDYETLASASPWTELGTIATVQRQIDWEHTLATSAGTLLLLAEHLRQEVRRPGAPYEVGERRINALAAGLDGRAGAHSWQASLRRDRNSQFGSQNTGSLAYGFDLTPAWRVTGAWGSSFVAPSFNLLYFPGFSNPELQPERGRHGELALQWTGVGGQARLARFDNRIRGFITSGPAPVNVPRTRVDGWSASYERRAGGWLLAASVDHLDPRNTTAGSANAGKRLPRRVDDSLRLAADTRLGGFDLGATLAAFGHRYDDAANTARLPGYATLDLRADWSPAPDWALGLRLNNAGDRRYETVLGYNQPGRTWMLTLRHGAR